MGRYIDIDDAIEIVTKIQGMWATTLHALCDAPKIDIVRCKECKYRERCEQIVVFDIGENQLEGRKIDFCSYGERSDT